MIDPILKSPAGVAGSVAIGAARPVAKAEPVARRPPEPLPRPASAPTTAPTTSFAAPSAAAAAGAPPPPVAAADLAERRSAGYEEGKAEGKAAAQREFATLARSLNEQVAATLAGMREAHQRLLEQLQQRSLDIAFAATVKVFGTLSASPQALQEMVKQAVQQALQQSGLQADLQIHLNPADLHALQSLSQDPAQAALLCADPSLPPGGCVIRGAQGDVDAGIPTQLASLADLLQRHRHTAAP